MEYHSQESRPSWFLSLLAATVALLILLALSGPNILLTNDQEKVAGYVADIIHNGSWWVQRDQTNDIASKPPVQTWLATLSTLAVGRDSDGLLTEWALRLPSLLSVMLTALLIGLVAGKILGPRTGALAALVLLLSMPSLRMVGLIRTDPLFMLLVTSSGLLLWRLFTSPSPTLKSWLLLATMLSLATLTKGPLGILLALMGLFALPPQLTLRSKPLFGVCVGIILAVVTSALWLLLAIQTEGHEVWDKIIGKELVGLATSGIPDDEPGPAGGPWSPWLYLLPRFFPWSIILVLAPWFLIGPINSLWQRQPVPSPSSTLLRYSLGMFVGGMLLFMASAHHRMDHLYPLLPFLAILLGWALDQLLREPGRGPILVYGTLLLAIFVFLGSLTARFFLPGIPADRTMASRLAALEILKRTKDGQEPVFLIRHGPQAVQYFLGINRLNTPDSLMPSILASTTSTLFLSRERSPLWATLGFLPNDPVTILYAATVPPVPDQIPPEEVLDTDLTDPPPPAREEQREEYWTMGLARKVHFDSDSDSSATQSNQLPWAMMAVTVGTTQTPTLLINGPVHRANRRGLWVENLAQVSEQQLAPGIPPIAVYEGLPPDGRLYPQLPYSRPFSWFLWFLAHGGLTALVLRPALGLRTKQHSLSDSTR